ncbi:hypothetical protein Cfor_12792 [Coptotermes formosanus]|uniref:Uncharacterized protein n=1 Tax=Coptotermes formosanus TaxID=36987 RepID=A0A6L2PYG2_COPFO|nr:hypothetical protein Cfor_12792 [Coptotermes formosanus]
MQVTVVERNALEAFRMVVTYFLGKNKYKNYEEIVESLIQHYEVLCCRIPDVGDVSEEHGECFHQDVEAIEKNTKDNGMPL